jgi:hypothetical protein
LRHQQVAVVLQVELDQAAAEIADGAGRQELAVFQLFEAGPKTSGANKLVSSSGESVSWEGRSLIVIRGMLILLDLLRTFDSNGLEIAPPPFLGCGLPIDTQRR